MIHFAFKISSILVLLILWTGQAHNQDIVKYTGSTLCNVDYHHGQLPPAKGVHNIQVLRANREYPQMAEGYGWTYNHAPMMAYWNNTFYLEYLSDSVGEHIPPGQTLLVTSDDGYSWSDPIVLFPPYKVPDGTVKEGYPGTARDLYAVMHQRMGFYVSGNGRLLALAYYGICMDEKDNPNDGKGIGRVVLEIFTDRSMGPVYFIRYNASWNQKNTSYPFYKESTNKGFVKACDELLANPLMMQQWNEEADRYDPLIPLKKQFKAFCYYHLPDGRVAGLWKYAFTAISDDGGRTWPVPVRAPGFVTRNAKIWGQRTSDGRYAAVYNPSEFRWPLAVSVSENGIDYNNLLLVNGEIPPMRYGGNYKSYGPQYVRGIPEGNGIPSDGNLWVTYSMNKEDIWVSEIPVPVQDKEAEPVNDIFNLLPEGEELGQWNIYSPLWAPVKIEEITEGIRCLSLSDWDRYDYAKAERLFPASDKLIAEFSVIPGQNNYGLLHIEFQNEKGTAAVRLVFDSDSTIKTKYSYRYYKMMNYKAGKQYDIRVELDVNSRSYDVKINGENEASGFIFFAPVVSLERIVFRTGEVRRFPDPDTPAEQDFDLPHAGEAIEKAVFYIKSLKISEYPEHKSHFILDPDDFRHYIDFFNGMENENILQAVSNDQSWEWMCNNIPFFECPQDNFEEIYYFRWWTLRKHIRETPGGYAFTEFLVDRPYADKYNLISCALGHHIYEARWLHNRNYLDDCVHLWYRGNNGKNMDKLRNFSNWTADALYNRFLVDGDSSFLIDMLPDLDRDYMIWESMRLLPDGLFWQYDVSDGMEESISGGRNIKNIRPTINSYMYGNAIALNRIAVMSGNNDLAEKYAGRADTLKLLVQLKLWNPASNFFETVKENGEFAGVREAIGYIPWYFSLPDKGFEAAWKQVTDTEGFLAPFGLTTAERRHPEFRSHGCCKCEWDGAVWPFATSQSMTAMANFMNNYDQSEITDSVYFRLLELYVESQYYRGHPYIGEYLDEKTGYWLKGDEERSRYYNHSTFCDLVITGLVGLRPHAGNIIEVSPLVPEGKWDWFCLDNILYHGEIITVLWDRDGKHYKRGKGLHVLVNGKETASSDILERIIIEY
jgi:hypothetical protein